MKAQQNLHGVRNQLRRFPFSMRRPPNLRAHQGAVSSKKNAPKNCHYPQSKEIFRIRLIVAKDRVCSVEAQCVDALEMIVFPRVERMNSHSHLTANIVVVYNNQNEDQPEKRCELHGHPENKTENRLAISLDLSQENDVLWKEKKLQTCMSLCRTVFDEAPSRRELSACFLISGKKRGVTIDWLCTAIKSSSIQIAFSKKKWNLPSCDMNCLFSISSIKSGRLPLFLLSQKIPQPTKNAAQKAKKKTTIGVRGEVIWGTQLSSNEHELGPSG